MNPMNPMPAQSFISHRLFVAALSHDESAPAKGGQPDRIDRVETGRASPARVRRETRASRRSPAAAAATWLASPAATGV